MSATNTTGLILAGGLARRMNQQDKGLVLFKGQPLISYAIAAMSPVVTQTLINANRNHAQYQTFGLPVVADQSNTFDGPLAGILTAIHHAESKVLLVMPCDCPLATSAHLQKLLATQTETQADITVAFDGERMQSVFLALKTSLQADLKAYLDSGERKVETWLLRHYLVKVDFSGQLELFTNINTLAELTELENSIHN